MKRDASAVHLIFQRSFAFVSLPHLF